MRSTVRVHAFFCVFNINPVTSSTRLPPNSQQADRGAAQRRDHERWISFSRGRRGTRWRAEVREVIEERGDGRARSRSGDRRSRCGVTDQDAEEEIDGRPRSRSDGRSRCSGDGGAEEEMEVGARCSRSDGRSRATQRMASEVPGDAVLEVGEDLLRVHHARLLRRLPAESGTSATLGRPEAGC